MRQSSAEIRQVMETMNDIIWAVKNDPQNDVSFMTRIKDYFYDLLDSADIIIHYQVNTQLERRITNANVRKNLLLITKESINNCIKHSGGTLINVKLEQEGDQLILSIADNGKGMGEPRKKSGNGLKNIRFRAEQMHGMAHIEQGATGGTCVTCHIPITIISV
jgi:signal transduction histidine kinase